MQVVEYKGDLYPHFQTIGNASQFAIPYAQHVCKGKGYDIGCMKQEWAFPGATPIDLDFDDLDLGGHDHEGHACCTACLHL